MLVDNKQKRINLGNRRFFFSVFCTFFFLLLYLLGLYYIPAPESFLRKLGQIPQRKLFGRVLESQMQVNFVIFLLSVISSFVLKIFWEEKEIEEKSKLKNRLSVLSKILKPNAFALSGVYGCWSLIKNSYYLIFLTYLSFFISNSIFEIIVRSLSDYGVCEGFDLIFLIDKFPFLITIESFSSLFRTVSLTGNYSDLERTISLLSVSVISYFFISVVDKKWEVSVNNNRISSYNNSIDYSQTLLFRMNFNVFTLSFISTFIKIFMTFWRFLLERTRWSSWSLLTTEFFVLWNEIGNSKIDSPFFSEIFLAINNSTNPFFDLLNRINKNKNFFLAITCWIVIIHFLNWLTISNSQLNSQEISERLEKNGVYVDGVRPGRDTKKLISNAVNNLVILWAFHITLLMMSFDNVVPNLVKEGSGALSSLNLFITISTSNDLLRQIRKKYDYSRFYD